MLPNPRKPNLTEEKVCMRKGGVRKRKDVQRE